MLLGELDLNAAPAVDAFNKLDDRQRKTTSSLGKLGGQLVSLAAGYLSLTAILHGFESALDLGSTLHDTSLRTGETIGDLVGLREAFQEAGLGADGVEPLLLKLQNALGGVNEEGEKTSDAFDALGIDMEEFSKLDALGQLKELQRGLAGIAEQGNKVQILRNLFGKSGGQLLSLLGDQGALEAGLSHSAALADVAERAVPAMDALGDSLDAAKLHAQELFFGALDKIAPALTDMIDRFQDVDFVKIGEGFASLVEPIIAVVNALHTVADVAGDALDAVLDFIIGPNIEGPRAEFDKAGVEKRRNQAKKKGVTPDVEARVGSLQKIGLGGFGTGADPYLAESRRHTQLLEKIALNTGHLITGHLQTGNLDRVPV
jgi:hypothetical protein